MIEQSLKKGELKLEWKKPTEEWRSVEYEKSRLPFRGQDHEMRDTP